MSKVNYVMVKFSDGDYRVYTKKIANKRTVAEWMAGMTTAPMAAEVVAESTDKDALIGMAKIAREDFLGEWDEHDLVDRTEAGDFP